MNLSDLLSSNGNRSAERLPGVMVAVVTDNQDPEKLGRVKLQYTWLGEVESDWARVVSFMAGKDRGAVYLPEVDDEVLVAFESGDMNHPYVLGGLWSSEDPPPETNEDGKNNFRRIRSRKGHEITFRDDDGGEDDGLEILTHGGHELSLDDASKAPQIRIKTGAGHQITLDDTDSGPKIEIQSAAGHRIVLDDASGRESIEVADKGGNKIKMDAVSGTVSIESSTKLELKSAMIDISASGQMKLSGGAMLEAKGGLVKIN